MYTEPTRFLTIIFAACLTTGLAVTASAQETMAKQAASADTAPKGDLYTLDTCPISGKKLGAMGDPIVKEYDGREVRFCCPACVEPFEKDKAKHFEAIDKKLIEQQMPYYPLDTCVVMGDSLKDDKGEDIAVNYVYKNRLVRLCCKMCIKDFNKDPQKFLEKLDAAVIEKQRDHYPLETCVISGQKLGSMGEPVEHVYGNRLVRFCCKGCVAPFEKNPTEHIAKLDAAWKEMHEKNGHDHDAGDHKDGGAHNDHGNGHDNDHDH